MEHLLKKSKCSIFHNIFIDMIFQRRQKALLHSKALKNEPQREKTGLRGFANNKGADQSAHWRRVISAFVIRFLESIMSTLATSRISIF